MSGQVKSPDDYCVRESKVGNIMKMVGKFKPNIDKVQKDVLRSGIENIYSKELMMAERPKVLPDVPFLSLNM